MLRQVEAHVGDFFRIEIAKMQRTTIQSRNTLKKKIPEVPKTSVNLSRMPPGAPRRRPRTRPQNDYPLPSLYESTDSGKGNRHIRKR